MNNNVKNIQNYMNQLTSLACIINHRIRESNLSKNSLKKHYAIADALAEQLIIFDELLDEYAMWLILVNKYNKTNELRMNSYFECVGCFVNINNLSNNVGGA